MKYTATRSYLLSKPGAYEDFPFGSGVAVFKVADRMFALLVRSSHSQPGVAGLNLKCDPDVAAALRDIFPAVIPAWHMNKVHWNTVLLDASVPRGEIRRMVDMSYSLVVKKLKRGVRLSLEVQHGKDTLYALTPSVFA